MSIPVITGGEALARSILSHGVDTVFGIPGNHIYDFFDSLHRAGSAVRLITPRHEQGAGYMAFGYAHSTGKPSVCAVVPGPGLLNTGTALLQAYSCNARVLCITGQIPSAYIGQGIGFTHEIQDQLGAVRSFTKWTARISHPSDAPRIVCEAFKALHTGRPRPVVLEMPIDIMAMQCVVDLLKPVPSVPALKVDPDLIKRAARILNRAKAPLIMIGGGAVEAGEEVKAIAELLQAPVVAHRQGRGTLTDRHYLSQSYPAGHRLWSTADVILAVGTRLKYPLLYWGTAGLKIIRIDIDPSEGGRIEAPAIGIVGDAKNVLGELLQVLERDCGVRSSRRTEMDQLKLEMQKQFDEIEPQMSFLRVIREELPDDGIFVDEITQVGFASWFSFPVYMPRHFISCGYQGTLGYGLPTAIGVQLAHPAKKVIQVSGDGGFMYNVQEIATAVRYKADVVCIVFRDDRFGNVFRDQKSRKGDHVIGSHLYNPNFVDLAESFGAMGLRAPTPGELRCAIRKAFNQQGPTIIEVPVGEMQSPWKHILMPQVRFPTKPPA